MTYFNGYPPATSEAPLDKWAHDECLPDSEFTITMLDDFTTGRTDPATGFRVYDKVPHRHQNWPWHWAPAWGTPRPCHYCGRPVKLPDEETATMNATIPHPVAARPPEYTGPMAPDHKLGGIYAIMDRHGMLPDGPDGVACTRCAKPLNADGGHPAELYAGTYNGLCYGCTSEGPYVARMAVLDGAREVSWPPHCPSWRRDRENHIAYEGCPDCDGLGITLGTRTYSSGGRSCEPCMTRYTAHPVRAAASRWTEQVMRSCQAEFERAWDTAAGVPKRCSHKRRMELRAAYAGPDREHATPEFTAFKAAYSAGYTRIRVLVAGHFEARGWNQWTDTRDEEEWVRAYCTWRRIDYGKLAAGATVAEAALPPEPVISERDRRIALLRSLSWERAGQLYRRGDISQVEYEAFGYAWRRGAYRYSSAAAGMEHPVDAAARDLGNAILGDKAPGTCPCPAGENCTR